MDLLKSLAAAINERTGEPAEPEPSKADNANSHFKVAAKSFWVEPDGVQRDEGYSFVENGKPIIGYRMAMPIRVSWVWAGTGESFRAVVLTKTAENVKYFQEPFLFNGQGQKVPPGTAYDKMKNTIPDFDEKNINGIQGRAFWVELTRNESADTVFAEGDRGQFNVAQVFDGFIYTEDGQRSNQQ